MVLTVKLMFWLAVSSVSVTELLKYFPYKTLLNNVATYSSSPKGLLDVVDISSVVV